MRIIAAINDLRKQMRRATEAGAAAVRGGVDEATTSLKMRLRYQTRSAGLGARLAQTWRSNVKPKVPSYDSDGMVWSKVPHIMRSHGFGATIRPVRAKRLAVPLPAAGKGPRGSRITPAQWERKHGVKLVPVKSKDGRRYLVAPKIRGYSEKGVARISKAKKPRTALTSGPIFELRQSVTLQPRMDIMGAANAEIRLLPGYIADRWRKAL